MQLLDIYPGGPSAYNVDGVWIFVVGAVLCFTAVATAIYFQFIRCFNAVSLVFLAEKLRWFQLRKTSWDWTKETMRLLPGSNRRPPVSETDVLPLN